jgi:hypothetical protein
MTVFTTLERNQVKGLVSKGCKTVHVALTLVAFGMVSLVWTSYTVARAL